MKINDSMFMNEMGYFCPRVLFLTDTRDELLDTLHVAEACNKWVYNSEKLWISLEGIDVELDVTNDRTINKHLNGLIILHQQISNR